MAGQIEAYRKEIFNFLRTCTIKFEPFAYLMGQSYMEAHGLEDPNGTWNPYYQNLAGEYADNDEKMTVYSLETGEMVPFDKHLITNYPKTAARYRIPNIEYTNLEERYPHNKGLIAAIAYPIPDMQTAIKAPNLTLLSYDDSLLESNERSSLVKCLKDFLAMVRTRWFVVEYTYEDMYAATFWALLWQVLPNILLCQRFLNQRTPYVHSLFIWEYLKSHNIGDYRDILTSNQALWLYRNLDYILRNRGKNSNLEKLARNLLGEVATSLVDKNVEQTQDGPRIISYDYLKGDETDRESIDDLTKKLKEMGLTDKDDPDTLKDLNRKFDDTKYNELITKFLELQKDAIDTSQEREMVNFFIDTLMYRYTQNDLSFQVTVNDPVTNENLSLDVADAVLLMNYTIWLGLGETDPKLPTKFRIYEAFQRQAPKVRDVREYIYLKTHHYPVKGELDLDYMINKIGWWENPFAKQADFVDFVCTQYQALLSFERELDNSNKYQAHEAVRCFLEDTRVSTWLEFSLTTAESYPQWRVSNAVVDKLCTEIEGETDQAFLYNKLAVNCFDALFPMDMATASPFPGTTRHLETIYTAIRDLFISLGSYNVTYLETSREEKRYLKIQDPLFALDTEATYYFDNILHLEMQDFKFLHHPMIHDLAPARLELALYMNKLAEEISMELNFAVDAKLNITSAWHYRTGFTTAVQFQEEATSQVSTQPLSTAEITIKPTTSLNAIEG